MKAIQVGLLALALAVPSAQAIAKDKVKMKVKGGKGHGGHDRVVVADAGHGRHVVFVDADKTAYRNWWRSAYGTNCPPGLVRRDNYCLPPGQAKRRYVVGQALPTTIVVGGVPSGLRLSAAPAGYRYVYVDGDLLLIDTTTRLVADVIANIFD